MVKLVERVIFDVVDDIESILSKFFWAVVVVDVFFCTKHHICLFSHVVLYVHKHSTPPVVWG